jgi:MFS family permease
MENPAKSKKHWLVLACACGMAAASIGLSINVIGVFYTPVSEALNIYRGSFAFHNTIASIAMAFVSLIIPQLIYQIGWKPALSIGVALGVIGTSGMGFTTSVTMFYILGALRGAGTALFAMVPLTMIVNGWFEEKNGLAMSVSFGMSGIAGAILSPVFTSIIEQFGWDTAFIIKGIVIGLFCLPALIYPYSLDPKEDGYLPFGHDPEEAARQNNLKKKELPPFSYASIAFIALFIFSFLHTNIIGMSQHLPGFGESLGMTPLVGGWMMSAAMLGNITFKLIIGTLADKIGIVKSTVLMIALNVLAIVLLITWQQPVPLVINSWLFGTMFCIPAVAFPLLSNQFFGRAAATRVYPILTFAMGIGGAISVTIIGYIFDFTGSYQAAFLIAIGFNLINLALLGLSVKTAPKAV